MWIRPATLESDEIVNTDSMIRVYCDERVEVYDEGTSDEGRLLWLNVKADLGNDQTATLWCGAIDNQAEYSDKSKARVLQRAILNRVDSVLSAIQLQDRIQDLDKAFDAHDQSINEKLNGKKDN